MSFISKNLSSIISFLPLTVSSLDEEEVIHVEEVDQPAEIQIEEVATPTDKYPEFHIGFGIGNFHRKCELKDAAKNNNEVQGKYFTIKEKLIDFAEKIYTREAAKLVAAADNLEPFNYEIHLAGIDFQRHIFSFNIAGGRKLEVPISAEEGEYVSTTQELQDYLIAHSVNRSYPINPVAAKDYFGVVHGDLSIIDNTSKQSRRIQQVKQVDWLRRKNWYAPSAIYPEGSLTHGAQKLLRYLIAGNDADKKKQIAAILQRAERVQLMSTPTINRQPNN